MKKKIVRGLFIFFLLIGQVSFCFASDENGGQMPDFRDSGGMEANEEDLASAIEEYQTAPPVTRYLLRSYLPEEIWINSKEQPLSIAAVCSTERGFLFHQAETEILIYQMTEGKERIRIFDSWAGYRRQEGRSFYTVASGNLYPYL